MTAAGSVSVRDRGPGGMTRCSFCGKSPDDVRVILTSGESAICDECVLAAFDTISDQPGHPLYLRVAYSVFVAVASVGRSLSAAALKLRHYPAAAWLVTTSKTWHDLARLLEGPGE